MSDAANEMRKRIWDGVAAGYAGGDVASDRNLGPVSDWMISAANPRPGQVVLDLAAGAGTLAHRVARDIGPDCHVLCTDFAPAMVAAAQRLGQAAGLTDVDYRELDAERMDLDDDSVDVVLCRMALMVMPEPGAVLRETRRVLRPGGTAVFTVFAPAADNPWGVIPLRTFIDLGHLEAPAPGGPGTFALADPDHLRQLAADAGFTEVDVSAVDFSYRWSDDDDVWRFVSEINARLAPIASAMAADERTSARDALVDALAGYRTADGSFVLPARMWGMVVR